MPLLRALTLAIVAALALPAPAQESKKQTWEEYLRKSVPPKAAVEAFADPAALSWAKFHPELGYTLGNFMPRDGIDGSATISTAKPGGARTARMYLDKPCRINTYGDSYTQCHQVSDGETWQEYLAGHLGEPVRNFGMGGYGTYQAYRRMILHEATNEGAEYLIFYLYGDDHIRSLLRSRYAWSYPSYKDKSGLNFHGNFWPHLTLDLETGAWVEHENPLRTKEDLMKMTDPEFMVQALKDDLALQMYCFSRGNIEEIDMGRVGKLAEKLGVPIGKYENLGQQREAIKKLINTYGYRSSMEVLKKARTFAEQHKKKLMIVNFDPWKVMRQLCQGAESRDDQELVDFLNAEKFLTHDMNLVHVEDFKLFKLSFDDYFKRYFHGHYKPTGNHFFAYAIKDKLVQWLDPKPLPYQKSEEQQLKYDEYLKR